MKALLAVHGYPPELTGGAERHVQSLARALAASNHEVIVVAGTQRAGQSARVDESGDAVRAIGASGSAEPAGTSATSVRVLRLARPDLCPDHWQKSLSVSIGERFRAILRQEKPDVVHVHHWLRLSRDLVAIAAEERVPAVVTLHDAWTSCLLVSRVKPDSLEACEAVLGPMPCLACAQKVPPRTPWVPLEAQFMAIAEHRRDLVRELNLARAVIVPTRAHATALEHGLGSPLRSDGIDALVIAPCVAVDRARDASGAPLRPPLRTIGKLVLGSWDALSPLTGTDLILRALQDSRLSGRVELQLAGSFSDARFESQLRELAQGLDVRFHGPFETRDLGQHPVSAVHAFVSATRVPESYGIELDEARALGLPSVLPHHPAFVERASSASGTLLFSPGDPADLARVLARLLEERELLATLAAQLPRPEAYDPLRALLPIYAAAIAAGAPAVPAGADAWFGARMRAFAEQEWDRRLSQASATELGFEPQPGEGA